MKKEEYNFYKQKITVFLPPLNKCWNKYLKNIGLKVRQIVSLLNAPTSGSGPDCLLSLIKGHCIVRNKFL
jgi:hypothetical protein